MSNKIKDRKQVCLVHFDLQMGFHWNVKTFLKQNTSHLNINLRALVRIQQGAKNSQSV